MLSRDHAFVVSYLLHTSISLLAGSLVGFGPRLYALMILGIVPTLALAELLSAGRS